MRDRFSLHFLPSELRIEIDQPLRLGDAAARAGILLDHPCGARGRCSRCRVRFLHGAPPPGAADAERLSPEELAGGWRLSCRAVVARDATVDLPEAMVLPPAKSFGPPTLRLDSEAGRGRGIAVDLGSTTLAAALTDLRTTRVLAAASAFNPQIRFGRDIISRIHAAATTPGTKTALVAALRDGVHRLVLDLHAAAGADPAETGTAVLCGNAAMTCFLLGLDTRFLGEAPFHHAEEGPFRPAPAELGMPVSPDASVLVLPLVGGHIGGDTVAAIVATELDRADDLTLLVDLGTNAEVVLGTRRRLLAASAAAGPAFEGGAIEHGLPAVAGAVDRVSLRPGGGLDISVRGGGPPRGLCGSGLMDLAAALLEAGVIAPSGRMVTRAMAPVELPEELRGGLDDRRGGGHGFALHPGEGEAHPCPVRLTARDVRELQLAKGAISAAVVLLARRLGAAPADVRTVHLAGAFGHHLRKETALAVGLLPGIDPERIHTAGDAAGHGARRILCDTGALERALRVAREVEPVDLAGDAEYAEALAAAMPFPRTRR